MPELHWFIQFIVDVYFSENWDIRDGNLKKHSHLLKAAELKRRGITRYDAEIILSQGLNLPDPQVVIEKKLPTSITQNETVKASSVLRRMNKSPQKNRKSFKRTDSGQFSQESARYENNNHIKSEMSNAVICAKIKSPCKRMSFSFEEGEGETDEFSMINTMEDMSGMARTKSQSDEGLLVSPNDSDHLRQTFKGPACSLRKRTPPKCRSSPRLRGQGISQPNGIDGPASVCADITNHEDSGMLLPLHIKTEPIDEPLLTRQSPRFKMARSTECVKEEISDMSIPRLDPVWSPAGPGESSHCDAVATASSTRVKTEPVTLKTEPVAPGSYTRSHVRTSPKLSRVSLCEQQRCLCSVSSRIPKLSPSVPVRQSPRLHVKPLTPSNSSPLPPQVLDPVRPAAAVNLTAKLDREQPHDSTETIGSASHDLGVSVHNSDDEFKRIWESESVFAQCEVEREHATATVAEPPSQHAISDIMTQPFVKNTELSTLERHINHKKHKSSKRNSKNNVMYRSVSDQCLTMYSDHTKHKDRKRKFSYSVSSHYDSSPSPSPEKKVPKLTIRMRPDPNLQRELDKNQSDFIIFKIDDGPRSSDNTTPHSDHRNGSVDSVKCMKGDNCVLKGGKSSGNNSACIDTGKFYSPTKYRTGPKVLKIKVGNKELVNIQIPAISMEGCL